MRLEGGHMLRYGDRGGDVGPRIVQKPTQKGMPGTKTTGAAGCRGRCPTQGRSLCHAAQWGKETGHTATAISHVRTLSHWRHGTVSWLRRGPFLVSHPFGQWQPADHCGHWKTSALCTLVVLVWSTSFSSSTASRQLVWDWRGKAKYETLCSRYIGSGALKLRGLCSNPVERHLRWLVLQIGKA